MGRKSQNRNLWSWSLRHLNAASALALQHGFINEMFST
jgi:hypothetical protein